MIYFTIILLFFLAFIEIFFSKKTISPTLVMLSIWGASLTLCTFYEGEVGLISSETLLWIILGNSMFFIGGVFGRMSLNFQTSSPDLRPIPVKLMIPVYFLILFIMYKMYLAGSAEDNNWFVGMRKIINYGEPNIFFKIYGYIYYFIYPILYISAASYYKKPSKKHALSFWCNMGCCVVYAAFSTAKIKLLLVVIPVFFIRTYFRPSSTKLIVTIAALMVLCMYVSLFLLNKLSGNGDFTNTLLINIGNYTFSNIFSFDGVNFISFQNMNCIDSTGCQLLPFFDAWPFRTNVYTVMYRFIDFGLLGYSVFCMFIGFIHNGFHQLARNSRNILCVIIGAVLYFPLIFQIMDDQYTSSKYLLWIFVFTLSIYLFKRTAIFSKPAQ